MSQTYSISLKTTWQNILADLARYRTTDRWPYPVMFVMCPGSVAGVYYRIGQWIWYPAEFNKAYLYLLRPFYAVFKRLVEIYSGACLSTEARIGRGLYINNFGSIFVDTCMIGENCNLSHQVTIGPMGYGDQYEMPVIGDRVFIGAGVKIVGAITIGSDVAIGANAVVTRDLDDCAVAVGVPARVISYNGSFDFVLYNDMEADPARINSLHEQELWEKPVQSFRELKKAI